MGLQVDNNSPVTDDGDGKKIGRLNNKSALDLNGKSGLEVVQEESFEDTMKNFDQILGELDNTEDFGNP